MMSMADPVAKCVETLRIDSRCSLEKNFTWFALGNTVLLRCVRVCGLVEDAMGDA